jgi:hypothetical protein
MLSRAHKRKWLTIGLALVCAFGATVRRGRKKPLYQSSVTFRVTEGDLDPATAPRPKRALRSYIADAVFTNARLIEVIREHKLASQSALENDPLLALDNIRDDIGLEVFRNYFLEEREHTRAARSARVVIRYQARDPYLALEVVRHLARLVVEHEAAAREERAQAALAAAREISDEAREDLLRRRQALVMREAALPHAKSEQAARLRIEIEGLQKGAKLAEERAKVAEQEKAAQELRAELEQRQMGLRFELVDPGQEARVDRARGLKLASYFMEMLVVALLGATLAVGAFDTRIHGSDDVARIGVDVVGHVAAFPGDAVGALDARLRASHRVE